MMIDIPTCGPIPRRRNVLHFNKRVGFAAAARSCRRGRPSGAEETSEATRISGGADRVDDL